jgi:hypothetical protein
MSSGAEMRSQCIVCNSTQFPEGIYACDNACGRLYCSMGCADNDDTHKCSEEGLHLNTGSIRSTENYNNMHQQDVHKSSYPLTLSSEKFCANHEDEV